MNSNTKTARTPLFARRVLPVLGIVTLTIALGACQTPPQGAAAPAQHVVQEVKAPAGVDLSRPADRIEEQLQRDAAATRQYQGMTADRMEAEILREQGVPAVQSAPSAHQQIEQAIRDAQAKAAQDAATLQARAYELEQQSIQDALQKSHEAAAQGRAHQLEQQSIEEALRKADAAAHAGRLLQ